MLDLTISIVNHNSVQPLRACLESLYADLENISYEIYVVDNLCEELAADMLAQDFPEVKVITNSTTEGYGANHNQVLRTVVDDSKYILVLNPDTILPADTVCKMMEFLDDEQSVAVCSPKLVGMHRPLTDPPKQAIKLHRDTLLVALYISNANKLFHWLEHLRGAKSEKSISSQLKSSISDPDIRTNPRAKSQDVEVITGACMLFNALALKSVGLFDERFFLYFEEYDWCLRARQAGWRICLLPNIEVTHIQGYSTTRMDFLLSLQIQVESWLKFYRKHAGVWPERIFRIWLTFVAMLNIYRWSVMSVLQNNRQHSFISWREFSFNLIKTLWRK